MKPATGAVTAALLLVGGLMARNDLLAQVSAQSVVERFGDAVNRQDLDAVAALLTDDTVFENTGPAPDGRRYEGAAAVREFWRGWFAANAGATFEAEETIAAGDRVTVRWIYRKMRDGKPWHLRGVDVFTVREGKVAAKLSYVKG
jgi:ketosteroid isomerase-like protein